MQTDPTSQRVFTLPGDDNEVARNKADDLCDNGIVHEMKDL